MAHPKRKQSKTRTAKRRTSTTPYAANADTTAENRPSSKTLPSDFYINSPRYGLKTHSAKAAIMKKHILAPPRPCNKLGSAA